MRKTAKPLHPRGAVLAAELRRHGLHPATGSDWLDEPGVDQVLVRRSRAIGLPSSMPDIHGLALRVPFPDGSRGDLLFATTGLGVISRFILTASRLPQGRPLTTLLPYSTPTGPLLLSAAAVTSTTFRIACATPRGPWRPFADLVLSRLDAPDQLLSFDPLCNTVPGLDNYRWVHRLREPSYATARRSRSDG